MGEAGGQPGGAVDPGVARALTEVETVADLRARDRQDAQPTPADHLTALALGGGFLAFSVGCATQAPLLDWRQLPLVAALLALYALARRTELIGPTGSTVPTEPVLVALLFGIPLALVPVLVLAGVLLGGSLDKTKGSLPHQVLVRATSGWHCAGPVAVLWMAGLHTPGLAQWPVLTGALLAQFALDASVAATRCTALRARLRTLVRPLLFTFSVDALLGVLGVCTMVTARNGAGVVLLAAVPVALLRLLATDRNQRYSAAVTLTEALESVQSEARSDPLSGLANRRAWEEAVAAAEAASRSPGPQPAMVVLMADLDYLKAVNDTLGHDAGDELIRAFAAVLAANAPEGALVARLGGDEFGVLVQAKKDGAVEADALRDRTREAMAAYRCRSGVPLSASIGTAACPPAPSLTEAFRLADAAVRSDKHSRHSSRDTSRPVLMI